MKRLLIAVIFTAIFSISLLAQGTPGLGYTPIDDWTALEVYKGTATATEIVIPDIYAGLPMKRVAYRGFQSYSSMTALTIGNNVTIIGKEAFSYCSGLTTLSIPNSVTTIDDGAFLRCSGLTTLSIPNSVTTIGDYAF